MLEVEEEEEVDGTCNNPVVLIIDSMSEVIKSLTFDPIRETWEEYLEKNRKFNEKCEKSERKKKEFLLLSLIDEDREVDYVSTDNRINNQVDENDFNILFDKEIFDETFRKNDFCSTNKKLREHIKDYVEINREEEDIKFE
jgi:hypothetical protein